VTVSFTGLREERFVLFSFSLFADVFLPWSGQDFL